MSEKKLPQLMTAADVGRVCQLSARAVVRLAQEGRIPAPRIDPYRCKRWHPDDIERWMKTGKVR